MIPEMRKCCVEVMDYMRANTHVTPAEIERIIRSHESFENSVSHRLIVVRGTGYPVPNTVADEFRDLKTQLRQLQDFCAEQTRDLNMLRAAT